MQIPGMDKLNRNPGPKVCGFQLAGNGEEYGREVEGGEGGEREKGRKRERERMKGGDGYMSGYNSRPGALSALQVFHSLAPPSLSPFLPLSPLTHLSSPQLTIIVI